MKLNNADLLEEFYKEVKEKYPDISYEQIKEICFGPWRFLRQVMQYGNLESVRFMYLGKFQVRPSRARHVYKSNEKFYKEGRITEENFLKYQNQIEKFLNGNQEKEDK